MRLGRRTSLLVALYLLTSAAAAYAECAWVLWMSPPPKTSDLFWGPADSFQRLEECKRDTDRATGETASKATCRAEPLRLPPRHRGPARAEGEVNGLDGYRSLKAINSPTRRPESRFSRIFTHCPTSGEYHIS